MRRQLVQGLLLFSIAAWAPMANAFVGLCCGKCGGNMPMNIPGGGIPETHEFRFKFSAMTMGMDGLARDGNAVSAASQLGMPMMMGQPTGQFMAVPTSMDMRMLNFTMGYSFSDRLFGGVMLMHKDNSMEMQFSDMMAMNTGVPGFTMESSGVADTMLMGKYRLYADDPLIPSKQASFFFGLSLPTGSIEETNSNHPIAMRQSELLPYGMQLGSGTYDPTIGILYQGSASPYWWGVNAMYTARLHDNDRDYRLGDEARVDLYGMYQFRSNLLAQLQLNIEHKDKIDGQMDSVLSGASGHVTQGMASSPFTTPLYDTNNYGGQKVLATVGLQWQPAPLNIIDINVGIPVHQNMNGLQLEEESRVMLTWYRELPTKNSIRFKKPKGKEGSLGF